MFFHFKNTSILFHKIGVRHQLLAPDVKKLMTYYADFEKTVSGEGRLEIIENAKASPKEARK